MSSDGAAGILTCGGLSITSSGILKLLLTTLVSAKLLGKCGGGTCETRGTSSLSLKAGSGSPYNSGCALMGSGVTDWGTTGGLDGGVMGS